MSYHRQKKRANITEIISCNVAGQFMPYALSNVQRRQQETDCGDSLPLGSDVYVGWKSSYILKDLFVNQFTEHFLKYKFLRKFILPLYVHRTYCVSHLLLQTAAENNVIIILLQSHCTRTIQSTDKCFLGPYFKTKPQVVKSLDIARYASSGFVGIRVLV